jgi:methylenetetrahydrofolate reductase (NADPH)
VTDAFLFSGVTFAHDAVRTVAPAQGWPMADGRCLLSRGAGAIAQPAIAQPANAGDERFPPRRGPRLPHRAATSRSVSRRIAAARSPRSPRLLESSQRMKISQLFGRGDPVVSFEFFPPKTSEGVEQLYKTVEELRPCRPSFVSVTYGAGGSTRDRTLELVSRIERELGITTMAHLTCVGSNRAEIRETLRRLHDGGIRNILALRGDPPKGETEFKPVADGFQFASELVAFIREQPWDFCIGAACYPEGHVETRNLEADLAHLQKKVACGVDFLVSQLFFDNEDYRAFVRRARSAGITVPVVPGLMPVTNVNQTERFTQMCGARIPQELYRRLRIVASDPAAVVATGVQWAVDQGRALLRDGAPGLHFYTLNRSSASLAVHAALGL